MTLYLTRGTLPKRRLYRVPLSCGKESRGFAFPNLDSVTPSNGRRYRGTLPDSDERSDRTATLPGYSLPREEVPRYFVPWDSDESRQLGVWPRTACRSRESPSPLRLDRRVVSRWAEHIPAALGAAPSSDTELAIPIARVDSVESLASELGVLDEQVLNHPQLREHADFPS